MLLVTGGAGYVGSIVAERALARGFGVVVIDNLQTGQAGAVPAGATFVKGDVGDPEILDQVFRNQPVAAVCHLAADADVARSMREPGDYFRTNVVKSFALLEAMRRHHVSPLIFSSTAAVYGEPQATPVTESHPLRPINAYGASKLMFEEMIRWHHRAHGLEAVIFRYFNAAGATAERGEWRPEEAHLLPLAFDAALGRRGPLVVHGDDYATPDGSCVRDYVHVIDLADAHLAAIARAAAIGCGVFNLGSGAGWSVLEMIRAVERVTRYRVPAVRGPRRAGDPAVLVADAGEARRVLGWSPRHSTLDAIVASAWQWRVRLAAMDARGVTDAAAGQP